MSESQEINLEDVHKKYEATKEFYKKLIQRQKLSNQLHELYHARYGKKDTGQAERTKEREARNPQ